MCHPWLSPGAQGTDAKSSRFGRQCSSPRTDPSETKAEIRPNFQWHHTQQTRGTQSCRVVPAPAGSSEPSSLPGSRPPTQSCRENLRTWRLALRAVFTATLDCVSTGPSIWPRGWRLVVYITELSGKDSAGVSLAGTAPSCMSCAGRAHPPFILSEVATLAGCPVCHPRRLQETCSPASRFCCGSATDRTGALVASIIYKRGCSIRLAKKGKWGEGEGQLQDQKRAPHSFHPTRHSLSVA